MSRCSVCRHPEKAAIDSALARGTPYRRVAQQVRGLSPAAIDRHRRHLPATLVHARNAEAITESTSLLARIETLLRESEEIAKAAKRRKEWPAATAALREARSCLELLGRLRGELTQNGTNLKVQVGVVQASIPQELPENMAELEAKIAIEIGRLTNNFDPAEIERLKTIAGAAVPQFRAPTVN